MNKALITGGNRGLGLHLCERFNGTSLSRQTNHDILEQSAAISDLSLQYDVFINNAFDGGYQSTDLGFGQVKLLYAVAQSWQQAKKSGWIINIGGVGGQWPTTPSPGWETYGVSKSALKFHSQQWSQAFRHNQVAFRTSLITVDRLDTELGRSTAEWTGNGHSLEDIGRMIDLCLTAQGNTCIEEITAWVNLDHKQ